ncbi:hypothetical protein NQ317_015623 [Molorchus minor]|uniref:Retrotransposon gag domain-containing protein n=1 Tax=Molorchus minor TaxID=1323400 RepID=A0ABQ9JT43_9CUCU|nr:hypothetical protein NQ317_015623 [Molorchus minor]
MADESNDTINLSIPVEEFQRFQHEQQRSSATNNVDVNQLIASMQMMMQQNVTAILQMLASNQSIKLFSGEDLSQSKFWLESVESAAMLHHWPVEFTLETARSKLTGAAHHWYKARHANLLTWEQFKSEFKNTFIHENNLTHLWKTMSNRVQGPKEDLSLYFHEKVKLCTELHLSFDERKEQIAIGLTSREMATMMITKTHLDIDDLYRDLMAYERINAERRTRHLTSTNKPNVQTSMRSQKPNVATRENQPYSNDLSKRNKDTLLPAVLSQNVRRAHVLLVVRWNINKKSCPKKMDSRQSSSERSPDSSTNLVEQAEVVPSYQIQVILEVNNN